ncbi:MAG TPA: hypothetical protein VII19_11590, partial [Acidimicrobiales bacterium]
MSSDGPTLNDDSYAGGRASTGHAHSHGNGPSHSHPMTPGQHAHAHGKDPGQLYRTRPVDAPAARAGGAGHDLELPALPEAVDVFDTT